MRRYCATALLLPAVVVGGCNTAAGPTPGPRTASFDARFLAFSLDGGEPDQVVDRSRRQNRGTLTVVTAADLSRTASVEVDGELNGGDTVPGAEDLKVRRNTGGLSFPSASDGDSFLSQHTAGRFYALGTYSTKADGVQYVGYAVTGEPTGTLPTIVNATYSGRATGIVAGTQTGSRLADGSVELTASLTPDAGTIRGFVDVETLDGEDSTMRFDLNAGKVSGNRYSGTVSLSGTGGAPVVTSSAYDGRFYGPVATESAGTFRLSATGVPVQGTALVESIEAVGMFGGER